jgi:hypothetical protein
MKPKSFTEGRFGQFRIAGRDTRQPSISIRTEYPYIQPCRHDTHKVWVVACPCEMSASAPRSNRICCLPRSHRQGGATTDSRASARHRFDLVVAFFPAPVRGSKTPRPVAVGLSVLSRILCITTDEIWSSRDFFCIGSFWLPWLCADAPVSINFLVQLEQP